MAGLYLQSCSQSANFTDSPVANLHTSLVL